MPGRRVAAGAAAGNVVPRPTFDSVSDYFASLPPPARAKLEELRAIVRAVLPGAPERISYGVPAFVVDGRVAVYIAGFVRHVSIYPAPRGAPAFAEKLAPYPGGKGTVQFPLDAELPSALIEDIVRFRVEENRAKPPRKR